MEIPGASMDILLPEKETNKWMVITSIKPVIQKFNLFKLIQKDITISNSEECNVVIIKVFCFILSE